MKFQPFCSFAAILVGLLVAQSALAEDYPPLDPTCAAVDEAYVNTRRDSGYRELLYQPMAGGKTREYIENVYTADNTFWRYSGRTEWKRTYRPEIYPYKPRHTSCTLAGDQNELHYYTIWHKGRHVASGEVWLTQDRKKLSKVVRRYPPDDKDSGFPFSVVTSIFDYDAKKAQPPVDVK